MPDFVLQFDRRDIRAWAARYDYASDARMIEEVGPRVQGRGFYDRADFLELVAWKAPRVLSRADRNPEPSIVDVTHVALSTPTEALRIVAPQALDYVAWPIASVILHFGHADPYPILDFRVLESLGVARPAAYSLPFWLAYVEAIRRIASEEGGQHANARPGALGVVQGERHGDELLRLIPPSRPGHLGAAASGDHRVGGDCRREASPRPAAATWRRYGTLSRRYGTLSRLAASRVRRPGSGRSGPTGPWTSGLGASTEGGGLGLGDLALLRQPGFGSMSLGSHGAVGHAGAPTTDPPHRPRGPRGQRRVRSPRWKGSDVSGIDAERFVEQRVRAVVPADARVFANVRWVAPVREDGPARDGEVDLVVLLPNVGILAVETKGGPVRRDGLGRWYAGNRDLAESPFAQVETGKHVLASKIAADPRWQGAPPRMLHAVAFPDTDRDMLAGRGRDLGPDAPAELMFDRSDLADEPAARRAFDRVVRFWSGDGSRDRPIGAAAADVICDVLEPTVTLRPLLRSELEAGEREILAPTHHQLSVLRTLRGIRRAAIVGGAGSGKTLLAAEKARSLAADGFNVLLVCFNSLLAGALGADPALAPHVASGRLSVSTFHELCRRLGTEAGVLPTTPLKPGREWFEQVLPTGLELAIPAVGGRAQAIVVDEGQDFEASWLLSLDLLLAEPGEDVFYLFHDPSQALYRPDASGVLGLAEFELPDNCRNARPIHDFAYRWYTGDLATEPLREDGREPEIVVAEAGEATLDALREVLHRLVHTERIERARIAVLSGVALEHSAVWRKRRFRGDLTLWNGSVADDGVSRGLAADAIPAQPPRTIAIDTIHRFKGLERDVVVLVELRPDDERLGILLYVGASRAKHHLVVIATPELARRLGRMEA